MKYLRFFGNTLGTVCLMIGVFICLCETEDSRWLEFLVCGVLLALIGAFILTFVNNTKKCIKFFEGFTVFVAYKNVQLYEKSKNWLYKTRKLINFVKYYRKRGYSWKQIEKIVKKTKRKYVNFEDQLEILALQDRCNLIVNEIERAHNDK